MKPADLQEGDVCRYNDGRIAYRVRAVLPGSDQTKVSAQIQWEQDGGLDVRTWDRPDVDVPSLSRPTRPQHLDGVSDDVGGVNGPRW